MKLLPFLALAAVATVAASNAQAAANCGNRPTKLAIPDGATAPDDQMKATQTKFPAYAKDMGTYIKCLTDEAKGAHDEYDSEAAEWKKQTDIFQKTPAK